MLGLQVEAFTEVNKETGKTFRDDFCTHSMRFPSHKPVSASRILSALLNFALTILHRSTDDVFKVGWIVFL